MTDATLLSIQVGQPRTYAAESADGSPVEWTSAFVKEPVTGPVLVHETQISGDAQVDLENHGGPDKAVLAYAAGHYPVWREELADCTIPHGGFGENLTIAGLDENSVCLGDLWRVGKVRLEVSQPRQPCWKLARRWNRPDLPKRVIQTGRTGWYLRVLATGAIEAGQSLLLERRGHPEWTVARASAVMYDKQADTATLEALAQLPVLADSWRSHLAGRVLRRRMARSGSAATRSTGD